MQTESTHITELTDAEARGISGGTRLSWAGRTADSVDTWIVEYDDGTTDIFYGDPPALEALAP
jgi:hypothetical protein